jgi:pimeloyl-ACP methyl ester carboxylesterase
MAELESRWTTWRGLRVHERRGGGSQASARPAVLVHGFGVSSRYFVPLARVLAEQRPVVALDLPGSGRSERPPRALSVPALARMLEEWLPAAGLRQPLVVANSMGCQVVVHLAARRPDLTGPLVLVGPTVDPHARTLVRQAARLAADAVREPPALVGIAAADYARFGPVRLTRTARFVLVDAIERKLPLVQAPVLVVRGSRDALVPQSWAEEAAGLLPRGLLAVVDGEAHACHFSAPDRVAVLVERFLEEVEHDRGEGVGRLEHRDMAGPREPGKPDVR